MSERAMTPERASNANPLGSQRYFQTRSHRLDSAIALFSMAQALAAEAELVVDVGCGRGALIGTSNRDKPLQDLRGPGRRVVGIDVDTAAAENPIVDEFRAIQGPTWPLADGSVDLAVCDWVLEHVTNPDVFVSELTRVLRPGGAFLARTVSRTSLVSMAARLVPNERHSRIVARLQPGRASRDVFPTAYAMNDPQALAALFDDRFEWSVTYHPGLEQYFLPRPRLERLIAAVEPRLPMRSQHVLILAARRI